LPRSRFHCFPASLKLAARLSCPEQARKLRPFLNSIAFALSCLRCGGCGKLFCDPIEAAIVNSKTPKISRLDLFALLPCRNLIGSGFQPERERRHDGAQDESNWQRLAGTGCWQRATLKARLSKQERANDTFAAAVLPGALVLHRLELYGRDEISRALPDWHYAGELPGFLTRDMDKEPFADLI
jgi:hypothetical protein